MGRGLDVAVGRLAGCGVEPAIVVSRAPRRPEGLGRLRVVRVREDGRELTVCAFLDRVGNQDEGMDKA